MTASESNGQKYRFFSMLLDTLGASLLRILLADKRPTATRRGREVIWDGEKQLEWDRIFYAVPNFG